MSRIKTSGKLESYERKFYSIRNLGIDESVLAESIKGKKKKN